MSRHTRDRSKESVDVKENLYELGLLTRPRGDSESTKSVRSSSRHSGKHHTRTAHKENLAQRPASSLDLERSHSLKKTNLATGTSSHLHPLREEARSPKTSQNQSTRAVAFSRLEQRRLQPQRSMGSLASADRTRSRRERTFIGGECAACEEPLEHTLRGERVLQFSCGHVAHEACFYEYIRDTDSQYCPTCDAPLGLDSARGGSILDLTKLSNMVRSIAQQTDMASTRSATATPMPWDRSTIKENDVNGRDVQSRQTVREQARDSRDSQRMRIERLGFVNQHSRNNSGNASSAEYQPQDSSSLGRKHDYDVHAMETTVTEPPQRERRNTIPSPTVTVRSEFPTLTRSQHQQSLTCLVTIEVPEPTWRSNHDHSQPSSFSAHASPNIPSSQQATRPKSPRPFIPLEPPAVLEEVTEELRIRVENWHGLEFHRFGNLRLHGLILVSKDRNSWQELECYLFGDRLICVKEKKSNHSPVISAAGRSLTRCTLKGSIFIKKQLKEIQTLSDERILTLNLSVTELPTFHLRFPNLAQLEMWRHALHDLHQSEQLPMPVSQDYEPDTSGTDDDDYSRGAIKRGSSIGSSFGGPKSSTTAPTEYSSHKIYTSQQLPPSLHIPLDLVVVIPVSSSMQGLKITLLKDTLRFLVNSLGERDRMGLVTFGSSQGGMPLVGMTTKKWSGWNKVLQSIRPVGQKSLRADVVEGANVAMDLLMQRKAANPISTILLISDSSTSENESVSFVVQRAEAAKIGIYSFGLGLTHKPDSMIELSSRTKASYLYVKDWMMLRECAAGCLGSLQSISHQNAKLKLKLPEGSPARFVRISGALQTTKRATGRDAEATLGDLRFGDKRDILVQLAIDPDVSGHDHLPQDHWETIVSGLEALGGSLEVDEQRAQSVEELPLLQAGLTYKDLHNDGTATATPRPSLLTITMLPATRRFKQPARPPTPPIPSHPSIIQRRMELLTSDMLTRALTLVSRSQPDRAHHLLLETRTILKGLAKGGLPPLPANAANVTKRTSPLTQPKPADIARISSPDPYRSRTPDSDASTPVPRATVDHSTMNALDADIESSLEWINHPAVFSRDSRKAVLQSIGVISSQRGLTFRTPSEALWAERIPGVRRLIEAAREWRETTDEVLPEET